ncbi:RNA polymerase II C-terminal domain kinase beta subunit [Parahypoxylon ruwenzoriense]
MEPGLPKPVKADVNPVPAQTESGPSAAAPPAPPAPVTLTGCAPPSLSSAGAGAPGAPGASERINYDTSANPSPGSSSLSFRPSQISINPLPLLVQLELPPPRPKPADSPKAATATSTEGLYESYNPYNPYASNSTEPETSGIHSHPEGWFSLATAANLQPVPDDITSLEDGEQNEGDGLDSDISQSPLLDSNLGEFSDSDDSYDSDDSDATITPARYAASVARHRASLQEFLINNLIESFSRLSITDHSDYSDTSLDNFGELTGDAMAPTHAAKNGAMEPHAAFAGPHLGTIKVGRQYIFESHIRRMFAEKRLDPAREANHRLQGIQVIESTREALLLPVKTYNAACTFYHRFRLEHPSTDYNYTEAALASLFVACKVEDTLKKSREILCAHHNLKNSDHPTTQDDKIFDQPYKMIIGLERYIIEAINFDFRIRYPQKILAKIVKKVVGSSTDVSDFFSTAFKMSIDMYKTYAPLKHTSFTCALVLAQLTALITGQFVDEFRSLNPLDWHTDKQCVAEVMLDLLDLYTQHNKATKVGQMFDLQVFIDTQIMINQHVERAGLSRYLNQCKDCESSIPPPTPSTGSPVSLSTPSAAGTSTIKRGPKGSEGGTTRFVFDVDEAVREKQTYQEYTKDEWEEYEEEVEEPIPDPRDDRRQEPRGPRGPRHGHSHGRGHGRGGFDSGWHPRNRQDRRRRGGGFY